MLQVEISVSSPVQYWPLFIGAGLLQSLVLLINPEPQLTGHGLQFSQKDHPPLTGHGGTGQEIVSVGHPVQNAPPFSGLGLSQDLDRVLTADPQLAEHPVQGFQKDQPPSILHGARRQTSDCLSSPTQDCPLLDGKGLLQNLILILVPELQDPEQKDQIPQTDQPPSIGQVGKAQFTVSVLLPVQSEPPLDGYGESHLLLRDLVADPQVTQQLVH